MLQGCKKRDNEGYGAHLERFLDIVQDNSGPRLEAFPLGQQISLYLDNLPINVADKIRDSYRMQLELVYGSGTEVWEDRAEPPTLGEICNWAIAIDLELQERSKSRQYQSSSSSDTRQHQAPPAPDAGPVQRSLPPPGSNYKGKNYDPNYQANKRQKVDTASVNAISPLLSATPTSAQQRPPIQNSGVGRTPGTQDGVPRPPRTCWNCGLPGHISRNCSRPANPNFNPRAPETPKL